jgi:hypothetical protein
LAPLSIGESVKVSVGGEGARGPVLRLRLELVVRGVVEALARGTVVVEGEVLLVPAMDVLPVMVTYLLYVST